MDAKARCWLCGRPQGLAQRRESWSLDCKLALVPRTDNPDDKPAQITNDLIINAAIWRNGGSDQKTTHICDDCLRVGLRAIKVAVANVLDEFDSGHDKDAELADMTQRLAHCQFELDSVSYAHNRMQERLKAVLAMDAIKGHEDCDVIKFAQFEANRVPAKRI